MLVIVETQGLARQRRHGCAGARIRFVGLLVPALRERQELKEGPQGRVLARQRIRASRNRHAHVFQIPHSLLFVAGALLTKRPASARRPVMTSELQV